MLTFRLSAVFLFAAAMSLAQPKFEAYPAAAFKGKPAAAKVERASDRMFRTRIREGAAKGPNFAGHFTIVQWGCGAGCVESVIVDAADGAVYHMPSSELPCHDALCSMNQLCHQGEAFSFQLQSELLIARGCQGDALQTVYLRWTGKAFTRLR